MKKKFFAILTVLALVFSLSGGALAAVSDTWGPNPSNEFCASQLFKLGLMKGTGKNPDGTPILELNRSLTRSEAITMLVRLIGKENYALTNSFETPFTDVEGWAQHYVGYAYEMGLTNGISEDKFGASEKVTASQYITFVLRALGYVSGKDFSWETPWTLSDPLGLTKGQYNSSSQFLRGDTAKVSFYALMQTTKGSSKTLLYFLYSNNAVKAEDIDLTYTNILLRDKVMELGELLAKNRGAVFSITAYDKNGAELKSGSGFFISADGKAITSLSIVKDAATATIKTGRGEVYEVLGIYDFREKENIALIKVDGNGFDTLQESPKALDWDTCTFELYFPKGGELEVKKGVLINKNIDINGIAFMQSDMYLNENTIGGALFDAYGNVIGIDFGTQNLAIPSSFVSNLSTERLTYFQKDRDYTGLSSVPDFGAQFGFEALSGISQSGLAMYLYNKAAVTAAVPDALTQYKSLLESKGFVYHGSFDGPETNGELYTSADMSVMLYFGTVKAEGQELLIVGAFSGMGIIQQ